MLTFTVIVGHEWKSGTHNFRNKYYGGASSSVYPASLYCSILEDDMPQPLTVQQFKHDRWNLATLTTECPEADFVGECLKRDVMGDLSDIRVVSGAEMFAIMLTADTVKNAVCRIPRQLWTQELFDKIITEHVGVPIPYYVRGLLAAK